MPQPFEEVVWITGVGAVAGLGAPLARRFAQGGYRVADSGRGLPSRLALHRRRNSHG